MAERRAEAAEQKAEKLERVMNMHETTKQPISTVVKEPISNTNVPRESEENQYLGSNTTMITVNLSFMAMLSSIWMGRVVRDKLHLSERLLGKQPTK